MPYSSLESVIESNKEGYYLALRQTQSTIRGAQPNWQPWLSFFLRALQRQKRSLEGKIDTEKLFLAAQPELAVKILGEVRKRGRITIGHMVDVTGASRSTLRDHLRTLVEKQHLVRYGNGKGSWYALP